MKAILLAGGKGTRLWPISRSDTPKQILSPFQEDKNLLEQTIERTLQLGFHHNDLFLLTSDSQKDLLKPYWDSYHLNEIITEPEARNTGPAILLATKKLMELQTDPQEPLYFFPSDHHIKNLSLDHIDLNDKMICFSIIPTRPETGYGYIQLDENNLIAKVKKFVEKPDFETAISWYHDWSFTSQKSQTEKYFWNSGIYGFSLNSFAEALKAINPDLYYLWKNTDYTEFIKQYMNLPKTPFDKLIAEQAPNLYCTPLKANTWRDIGTWQSVYDALSENHPTDNVNIGQAQLIATHDTKSCLIRSDKKINIACAGIENIAVIIEEDNILITKKNNNESMQHLIDILQKNHKDLI